MIRNLGLKLENVIDVQMCSCFINVGNVILCPSLYFLRHVLGQARTGYAKDLKVLRCLRFFVIILLRMTYLQKGGFLSRGKTFLKNYNKQLQFGLLCCVALLAFPKAFAGEFAYRGEFGVSANFIDSFIEIEENGNKTRTHNTQFQLALRGHLEAEYEFNNDLSTFLVLDPTVSTDGITDKLTFEEGLTEIYVLYRLDEVDITAGLERLPLETARLNVPFSIATQEEQNPQNDPKGFFKGIWGARAAWYPGDYRIRPALYYKNERLNSVISIRRNFDEFEVEAHGVYSENFSFGLSGSGLIDDIVVYGESWLLLNVPKASNPAEDETTVRATLGATSYWGDALWTVEGAYMPSIASIEPHPQLAGQIQVPFGDELDAITVTSRLGFLEEGVVGSIGFDLVFPKDDVSTTVRFNSQLSNRVIVISVGLDVIGFF